MPFCPACAMESPFEGVCHACFYRFSGGDPWPAAHVAAAKKFVRAEMEKPNTEQRAEIRAVAAARSKRAAGKPISNAEATLLLEAEQKTGSAGGMIEYWARGPDRIARPSPAMPPARCGQCVYLDLKPLDSGVRHCRRRSTWRWRHDDGCEYGEPAVDLGAAIDGLGYALRAETWRLTGDDLDQEIPF